MTAPQPTDQIARPLEIDPIAPGRALPFAARVQGILIVLLLVGFVLIGQGFSKTLYQIGLPLLVATAFLQIAFGNIPPRANAASALKLLALTFAIIAVLFVVSIRLAPTLIELGR
ncbi:MAG: hypothetical protein AVDCRST_MAG70-1136 [uncultured Thermomicrobiales bacterium]|uniref:Uncharacterized protein n=1 Tax=uncultured Thermomicrobiales bacterium TaxID=1645740 RepID=A0A6J4ULD5_9BACT|nr:MAG: hypothetical protein AVDCRST_MAG70-1136 [uncultured Thermomicrobiales bacterium]